MITRRSFLAGGVALVLVPTSLPASHFEHDVTTASPGDRVDLWGLCWVKQDPIKGCWGNCETPGGWYNEYLDRTLPDSTVRIMVGREDNRFCEGELCH